MLAISFRPAIALAAAAGFALVAADVQAQPTNVRAWYAKGQVFVVWRNASAPASPTSTVEIYTSAAPRTTTIGMTRVGKLFEPEYTGARLTALLPAARLLVPTPGGGTYRLAADEGVFAYTPRTSSSLFFGVVNTGSFQVGPDNSATTLFTYDPVNDPVRPHAQFSGATPAGNPYSAYVLWAEGSNSYDSARPDVPVLADADKNGVPHVFTITLPRNPLPAAPLSCLLAIHGGGGEYELFRPGVAARADLSLELTDGIVVTPDDSIYANVEGALERSNTSWFGYATQFDPFTSSARSGPPDGSVVVNFTQRRVHYLIDWLVRPNPLFPQTIDPQRIAMIGHSGGGRGTSHLTRLHPERFAAAVCYTPASDLSIDAAGRENHLRGTWEANLPTNIIGPSGQPLGVTDVFTMTTRLSASERDIPLTRVFYGKRDEEDAAAWSPAQRAVFDSLNNSQMGYMLFWDEREHGVEKWRQETNDAMDGHAGPWPDIGQWVAPVRTRRASGQYLVSTYRAGESYPGFFNPDQDPALPGRQLDPGPGDPNLGDPWGTWCGYFDWDTATIVDQPADWACTIFAAGLAPASIDNAPVTEFTADLAPRKTRRFIPAAGATVYWRALRLPSGDLAQSGRTVAGIGGVVKVQGLTIPREDIGRVRVFLSLTPPCPADFNGDGRLDPDDLSDYIACYFSLPPCTGADFNGDGFVDPDDLSDYIALYFGVGCP